MVRGELEFGLFVGLFAGFAIPCVGSFDGFGGFDGAEFDLFIVVHGHYANISDKHKGRGGEAEVEFGKGVFKAVAEVDVVLVGWDGPGKEGVDFGGDDTDETDDGENLADADFFEGEPEANQEENDGDDTDGVPEVGKTADFAYSPDAAILTGNHGDEADDKCYGQENFAFHFVFSCLVLDSY